MGDAKLSELASDRAVKITNRGGKSAFILICDHASNHVPEQFGTLGLETADLERHIAWDPGALAVARRIAEALDAPLVESRISRLVIDCNRPLDAPDLILAVSPSERIIVPANQNLSPQQKSERVALSWKPFHAAIDGLVEERAKAGRPAWLVSIHSFTPVFKGANRPWQIGVIHDDDARLAGPMIAALKREKSLTVGINEPYSPADRVYFTLERHARSRGLPCAMIEIRNDEIGAEADQQIWAERLAMIFANLEPGAGRTMVHGSRHAGNPAA